MKKLLLILICLFLCFEVKSDFEPKLTKFDSEEDNVDSDVVGKKLLCSGKVENSIYMYKGTGKILIGIEFFSSKVEVMTMVYGGLKVRDK